MVLLLKHMIHGPSTDANIEECEGTLKAKYESTWRLRLHVHRGL